MSFFLSLGIAIGLGVLVSLDLYRQGGRPVTYDALIHITTISQFYQAIKQGDFPVTWANEFGNLGLPLPLIAHQVPAYAGAFIMFFIKDPVTAFNLLTTLSLSLGNVFMFLWLKRYTTTLPALSGTLLFAVTAYRLQNVYIRGALPEILAGSLLILFFLCLEAYIAKPTTIKVLGILLSTALIALTHPMILFLALPSGCVLIGFRLIRQKSTIRKIPLVFSALVLGIGLAAYYLIPLVAELKYFYQSRLPSPFASDLFLSGAAYLTEQWPYVLERFNPGPRGLWISFNLPETLALVLGALLLIRKRYVSLFVWVGCLLFLTTPISLFVYQRLPFMEQLQFPYRFLTLLILAPPLIVALIGRHFPRLSPSLAVLCFLLVIMRLPQSYGKNFIHFDEKWYERTYFNLHSTNFNPIWSDRSENYPPRTQQAGVIEGEATIQPISIKNSQRLYQVAVTKAATIVDYTFYFPGWELKVDGIKTLIEFQDYRQRGLITYQLVPGDHRVELSYQPTKIRQFAWALSLFSGVSSLILLIWLQRRKGSPNIV